MTGKHSQRDCHFWSEAARNHVLERMTPELKSSLEEHLAACAECQKSVGELLRVHESLHVAFRAYGETLAPPDPARLEGILSEVGEAPEVSQTLRRIRRPINTMLWLSVLALSFGALAALAWLLYWSLTHGATP